jgi:hypothetical protein
MEAFAQEQQEGFAKANHLRFLLAKADALRVRADASASHGFKYGDIIDKRWFVEQDDFIPSGSGLFGQRAAREEQASLSDAIARKATHLDADDPAFAVADAIEALREDGREPDAVIVPSRVWVRPHLHRHPDFRWAGGTLSERRREVGYFKDVPVFDVAPEDADYIVVVALADAVRLVERHVPAQSAPLRTVVRPIDESRAAELLDSGHVNWDPAKVTRDAAVQYLVEKRVECFVDIDYQVQPGPHPAKASFRINLGPETSERPQRV